MKKEKQGYMAYTLIVLMALTLAVSAFGTLNVLNATHFAAPDSITEVKAVQFAEPTMKTAKIKLVVPEREVSQ